MMSQLPHMHNRNNTEYTDFVKEWLDDMRGCIDIAKAHGVKSMDKDYVDLVWFW